MHHFDSLKDIAKFFDKNYYEFLRYDEHTLVHDGVTYILELDHSAPVPLVKIGYFDDEDDLNLLLCVVDFGLLINTDISSDDKPDIYEYCTIVKDEMFNLSLYDLARFNYILERAKKDM